MTNLEKQILKTFKDKLKRGVESRIEDCLAKVANPSDDFLRTLITAEVEFRFYIFDDPKPSDYAARFPAQTDSIEGIFAAIKRPDSLNHSEFQWDGEKATRIGKGGMGIVFKVKHPRFGPVALKIMNDPPGDRAKRVYWIKKFVDEAEKLASLKGLDTVAQAFGVGVIPMGDKLPDGTIRSDRSYFIAMRYVGGENFRDLLPKLSIEDRIKIIASVADTMQQVHERNLIHRDLKPANIVVDLEKPEPTPFVVDFGIARSEDATATNSGAGTHDFMAPEQANASFGEIGRRTDVHGLGGLLYAALTGGHAPYGVAPGEEAKILGKVLDPTIYPELPSTRVSGLPIDKDLEAICMKCLAKLTANRYESAQEVAEKLGEWLVDHPSAAPSLVEDAASPETPTTSPEILGLSKLKEKAKETFETLIAQVDTLARGEDSAQKIAVDSNELCEVAFLQGLETVKERCWIFTDYEWGFWFRKVQGVAPALYAVMESLTSRADGDANKRLVFFVNGDVEKVPTKLRRRLDAAEEHDRVSLVEDQKAIHEAVLELQKRGCEVKVCRQYDILNYRSMLYKNHLPVEAGWSLYDSRRVDFFRVSPFGGDFHDVQILCDGMKLFKDLSDQLLIQYFKSHCDRAMAWQDFWKKIEPVLNGADRPNGQELVAT